MWKVAVVVIVLITGYLFIPRYDLLKKENSFADEFTLVQKGYWSADECRSIGKQYDIGYRCVKTSAWQQLLGKQHAYNSERQLD